MVNRHRLLSAVLIHAEQLLIVVLAALATLLPFYTAGAADLTNRRLTVGTSESSAVTTHTFGFNIVSTAMVGSIEFEYCENSPIVGSPCSAPAGLSVNAVAIAGQMGEAGFSVHAATGGNRVLLTRGPSLTSPQPVEYTLANITNPSSAQQTVFVRMSLYASDDASGLRGDYGSVVFSTARQLTTTGYVPPYLTFCVGITVAVDCSTADGTNIDFGELSRATPSAATSQFAGASNDVTGYSVSVHGNTMTSGNNIIPALALNSPSDAGTSQYGINLRDNSTPQVGQNPAGSGTAAVASGYGIANSFRYVPGETIANTSLPSNFNRFTVSYLVNVSGNQFPGVYATTMTYIATASF